MLHSALPGLLREAAQFLDILAEVLQASLIVRAESVHLESKKLTLVVPLGVELSLPQWVLTDVMLLLVHRDLLRESTGGQSHGWSGLLHRMDFSTLCSGLLTRRASCFPLAAGNLAGSPWVCASIGLRWLILVVMDTLHVVEKIVSSWEAIARNATLASGVEAEVRPVTVSMHSVGFSLVAKEASSGRELLLGACLNLAAEWLQVGVNELAVGQRR